MGCDGPDPPEYSSHELTPPPTHQLPANGIHTDESDDETEEYHGYQPLPQGPEGTQIDNVVSNEEINTNNEDQPAPVTVPPIEPMERIMIREVWNMPRPHDSIEMDQQRAQEVMSAMANFVLPQASIPEWAQSISEEQWKQTLHDRIEKIKNDR
ncbi:hypothetical protein EVAR_46100_1 [Eumeta japonica]|uniref:Male-enhanced antigen 1 n=1 Tax=Eumeta variegata TaxID=151549 RepID=A0A4C1XDY7_EUMVA|nr:hypothetical protein EVAR_46100_1 [Eumeta japonica]